MAPPSFGLTVEFFSFGSPPPGSRLGLLVYGFFFFVLTVGSLFLAVASPAPQRPPPPNTAKGEKGAKYEVGQGDRGETGESGGREAGEGRAWHNNNKERCVRVSDSRWYNRSPCLDVPKIGFCTGI